MRSAPVRAEAESNVAFVVGQDREGHWLAVETHGLGGGIFRTLTDAIHYAEFETDRHPGGLRLASEPIELAMGAAPRTDPPGARRLS